MGNLLEFMTGDGDGQPSQLQELRLGSDPAMVLLFTADTADVGMHFVDDASVNSYVICPGQGCPVCHVGSAAIPTMLLPVYEIGSRTIRVLRVPMRRQPGTLAACITPHVAGGKPSTRLLAITRNGAKYAVVAHQISPAADRGDDVIRDFVSLPDTDVRLKSAFRAMTPEELADIPAVANKIATLGTWRPPTAAPESTESKS